MDRPCAAESQTAFFLLVGNFSPAAVEISGSPTPGGKSCCGGKFQTLFHQEEFEISQPHHPATLWGPGEVQMWGFPGIPWVWQSLRAQSGLGDSLESSGCVFLCQERVTGLCVNMIHLQEQKAPGGADPALGCHP